MSAGPPFPIQTSNLADLEFGLDKIIEDKLKAAAASARPLFVHMLGIPGAGKSTFAQALFDHLANRLAGSLTFVGFDRVMSEIPLYQSASDRVAAFATYELPARAAGYALLKGLVAKKASVILDHSGSAPTHVEMLRYAKGLGYTAFMVHIQCSAETAKARILVRAEVEGRHTPLHYVDDRQKAIAELLPKYTELLHGLVMLDNSGRGLTGVDRLTGSVADVILGCIEATHST